MTATLTDARTELVASNADDVDHYICEVCWRPGLPTICGSPDTGELVHEDDCGHPTCPMCEAEWPVHRCEGPR